jgi:hypothetical protein
MEWVIKKTLGDPYFTAQMRLFLLHWNFIRAPFAHVCLRPEL